MVTIENVAEKAGVSVATVSRVINGSGTVKPATAQRVQEAIEQLRYVPNLSARNLRRNESRVILTLTPNFTNPYYVHILAGIVDTAHTLGYAMLHCTSTGIQGGEMSFLSMLSARRADGAIILGCNGDYDWLPEYAAKYPIVQCCEYIPGLGLPSVSIDNYSAARDSVEYLLSLGHMRIATISSVNNYISTAARMSGYRDALKAAGIEPPEEYIARSSADYSFQSGIEETKRLLALPAPPTAIFCISDILALSAIAAAEELGKKVPDDLTVVGFDDVDYTTMFHPYLTTIAQPCYELGRESMKLVADMIHSGSLSGEEIFLPHRLMKRESAAALR